MFATSSVIALLPFLIFFGTKWDAVSPPASPRCSCIFSTPPSGCDCSAAAGEQQAKCRVRYCAIVRGEIWNSCTQQIEVLHVHPLRWDDCLFSFLFLFLSFIYLFICRLQKTGRAGVRGASAGPAENPSSSPCSRSS